MLTSLLVSLGFLLFAIDETRDASTRSATQVAGRSASRSADPNPDQERSRERAHGTVREAIDDANDLLLAPFAGLSSGSDSKWARRGVPALVALVVFGLGGGFLARFARGRP